ncbi:hypothetical protein ACN429_19765 [Pseudomonas oryzihabitans]|uniref:hypothetical protein n=1 Tax=Pseudomonas oryzihabitans TaxID=47885 RepID=UPI00364166CC
MSTCLKPRRESLSWALAPDFPLEDLFTVAGLLKKADLLLPGYIAPQAGIYQPAVYFHNQDEGIKSVILPDRNVASRMAKVVQGGRTIDDPQLKLCAGLLGFAHLLNIDFEPSIAYHELAYGCGNASAAQELGWFRTANNAPPQDMLNVAMGLSNGVARNYSPQHVQMADMAAPTKRWNRNYIVALKVLELDYAREPALDKALRLLDWMANELVFAGPAMMLAVIYLGTHSPGRKKVFKGKGSADRLAAIAGVKNAAWDITHLSDFVSRINQAASANKTQYLFATFDSHLKLMAKLLAQIGIQGASLAIMVQGLSQWWSLKEAEQIAQALLVQVDRVNSKDHVPKASDDPDFIQKMISNGERAVIDAI